jgi:hypothetical protein
VLAAGIKSKVHHLRGLVLKHLVVFRLKNRDFNLTTQLKSAVAVTGKQNKRRCDIGDFPVVAQLVT